MIFRDHHWLKAGGTSIVCEPEHAQTKCETIVGIEKMKEIPYFGRIDFKENEAPDEEEIYIGISALMDRRARISLSMTGGHRFQASTMIISLVQLAIQLLVEKFMVP